MPAKARSPTKSKNAAFIQYSKRLASFVTIFWCCFRVIVLALLLFRPSLIDGMRNIIQGADDVMMLNVACYCGNSVAEKGITGYFSAKSSSKDDSGDEESDDDEIENG